MLGCECCRPLFLHRQFRVRVNVGVQRLQPGKQALEIGMQGVGY